MAPKTLEERIAQLDARKKSLTARLSKEKRSKDTRRKILLGALLINQFENGDPEMTKQLKEWVRRELPKFLTRDTDKELFKDLFDTQQAETIRME